jgi:hypothetical protein
LSLSGEKREKLVSQNLRFQNLLSNSTWYRYVAVTFNRPNISMTVKSTKSMRDVTEFAKWLAGRWWGLYKLNPGVTRPLESAWFQPLSLWK